MFAIHLAGVPVSPAAVLELAALLGDEPLAGQLRDAQERRVIAFALEPDEAEAILLVLDNPPPELRSCAASFSGKSHPGAPKGCSSRGSTGTARLPRKWKRPGVRLRQGSATATQPRGALHLSRGPLALLRRAGLEETPRSPARRTRRPRPRRARLTTRGERPDGKAKRTARTLRRGSIQPRPVGR